MDMASTYRSVRGRDVVREGLVTAEPVGAPVLLHLGLVEVAATADQLLARRLLELAEERVVAGVVVLDDLEAPPALQDVAPDQLASDPVGEVGVTRRPELVDGVAQGEVRGAAPSVEGVEQPTGLLDGLERLGQLAECLHGGVVDAVGSLVVLVGSGHGVRVPTPAPAHARPAGWWGERVRRPVLDLGRR